MGKRGVNFDAFDRELAESKPELAARIGVQTTDGDLDERGALPSPAPATALRIVPQPAPEGTTGTPDAATKETTREAAPVRSSGRLRGRVRRADGTEAGRQIVYLPIDLDERLRRYAFETGRSLTDVTSEILSEAIARTIPPLQ